ncbi:MAG: precorrin-8X methylmutase [Desulfobacterales bacterium]|nr:precorrin-8X methylmutase [Desulfobacterales bacterium]
MKPDEIEKLSFEIIDKEASQHSFTNEEWEIVRRMIHTSADFEYLNTVRFHPDAIASGTRAIMNGKTIITDTNMAKAGIRKSKIKVECLIDNPDIHDIASKNGITRAEAAVDAAIDLMEDGIYVIGNAPTALIRLNKAILDKKAKPALIVGLPVGFVNAKESKAALIDTNHPYITNIGRKGGSNIAASVINALMILSLKYLR